MQSAVRNSSCGKEAFRTGGLRMRRDNDEASQLFRSTWRLWSDHYVQWRREMMAVISTVAVVLAVYLDQLKTALAATDESLLHPNAVDKSQTASGTDNNHASDLPTVSESDYNRPDTRKAAAHSEQVDTLDVISIKRNTLSIDRHILLVNATKTQKLEVLGHENVIALLDASDIRILSDSNDIIITWGDGSAFVRIKGGAETGGGAGFRVLPIASSEIDDKIPHDIGYLLISLKDLPGEIDFPDLDARLLKELLEDYAGVTLSDITTDVHTDQPQLAVAVSMFAQDINSETDLTSLMQSETFSFERTEAPGLSESPPIRSTALGAFELSDEFLLSTEIGPTTELDPWYYDPTDSTRGATNYVINDNLVTFVFDADSDPNDQVAHGSVQNRITLNSATDTLTFNPLLRDFGGEIGTTFIITGFAVTGFHGVEISDAFVPFSTDGEYNPYYFGKKSPTSLTRSDDGDVLYFEFSDPIRIEDGVSEQTNFAEIQTNATEFNYAGRMIIVGSLENPDGSMGEQFTESIDGIAVPMAPINDFDL